jgi:CHAT domain-containing protein
MNKRLGNLAIPSLVAVLSVMGLGMGILTPTIAETVAQVSTQNQEALAEAERLTQQAFELYQQGKYNEAIPLAEQALAICKKVLGENHLATATSLDNLAELYRNQGRYAEAESLYQQALAIRKQQLGKNHPATATSLNNLALLYKNQGRYSEAERLYLQALAIYKQQVGDNHLSTAISLNNLAELYRNQGRYAEAEPLYQQALAITKQQLGENHPLSATSLDNLAGLYQSQGRYAEAELLHQQALAIIKQQLGENHPFTATSLNNLAGLYRNQGRYAEAEPLYQQALAIRKQQLGENHPSTAQSLNNLAGLDESQGRYSEAEPLYQQALAIRKQQLGDNHPDTATSLNNLAGLYQSQGRYAEAEPLYQQALAIHKQQLGENHPDTATSLNNLAGLYQSQGRYAEAEPLYQQALAIRKQQLGDNHPNTAGSLNNLAALYYSQDNLPKAIEYLAQGLNIQEYNLSENLNIGDEKQKQDYITTLRGTTNGVISLNLQSAPNNAQATQLALKTILESKGRILDVSTNSLQILRQRTDDPESQQLLTQFIEIRTQISNLTFKKPEEITDHYRQQLNELNSKAKEIEDKIGRRSAEFRQLSQPITLEAIQKLIPANSALVEIVRYQPFNPKATKDSEKYGNPRYAVYILFSNGEIKAKDLGETKPIDDNLILFRNNLTVTQTSIKKVKDSARKLDSKLMQPIRELLGDTKTILLSPDAALNLIPFEALVDEKDKYLVENYQITYLTSGRDLLRLKDKFNSETVPLIMANPSYNKEGQQVALNPDNTRSLELSEYLKNSTFKPLVGTKLEAEAIQSILQLPQDRVLTEQKATENALKQVKKPEILHIATHGFFLSTPQTNNNQTSQNFDNPLLRSGLVLAGVKLNQSAGDDGVLTALETTSLNLVGTKLVVLSACETGKGDITTGEGVYGLRRALILAGSESQLISLWKVSDDANKDLMIAYYTRLLKGEGRSEALRQIQLEMLKSENQNHPFYWASFIPSGDSTPMQFK